MKQASVSSTDHGGGKRRWARPAWRSTRAVNRAGRPSTGRRIGRPMSSNFRHRDRRSADRGRPPIDRCGRRSRGSPRCGSQHRRAGNLGRHRPAGRGYPRCALDTDKSGRSCPAGSRSPHPTSHQNWRFSGALREQHPTKPLATMKAANERAKIGRKKWLIELLRFDVETASAGRREAAAVGHEAR